MMVVLHEVNIGPNYDKLASCIPMRKLAMISILVSTVGLLSFIIKENSLLPPRTRISRGMSLQLVSRQGDSCGSANNNVLTLLY